MAVLFLASALVSAVVGNQAFAALKSTKIPRYDAAVQKAVDFLQKAQNVSERDKTIVAYALLKAGVEVTNPIVAEGIELARRRGSAKSYDHYQGTYVAAVDAMLLADAGNDQYLPEIQSIADRLLAIQEPNGCWSADPGGPGDVSLLQYSILGLWAAQRVGCTIDVGAFDRVANYLTKSSNSDGGWRYRPGTNLGPENGQSSHNMTLAAVGTLSISRLMLFPPKQDNPEPTKKFNVLEKVEVTQDQPGALGNFKPAVSVSSLDQSIQRGVSWNDARATPVARGEFPLYFYYCLERAASLVKFKGEWFVTYGDGLLTLQKADGRFEGHSAAISPPVATSFAILYFMRSTQQIIDEQFGKGILSGNRGLDNLFGGKEKEKKELGELDELLGAMEKADLSQLDEISTEDIVEKVTFSSRDELVGQVDLLKNLLKSKDAANRQVAYWALGRTGDFSLVPMMLQGLRDPSVDCNVEALNSLRYISRKPNGFGLTLTPLAGKNTTSEDEKLKIVNAWRTTAWQTWGDWYRKVRPFDEGGGLDEIELQAR